MQKSPIHTIDGCLKYLKGDKLPKVSQTLTMFADDDEVGKFDFQDHDDSNGVGYGDNDDDNDDDEDDFLVKGRPAVSGADGMMAAAAGEAGLHIVIIICVITIIAFILPLRCQVCHQGQHCHHHYCAFSLITVIIPVIITVIS